MNSHKTCLVCKQSICHASFSRHLKSHSNAFECPYCPSQHFNRRDSLIRHMKLHGSQLANDDITAATAHEKAVSLSKSKRPFTEDRNQLTKNIMQFKVDAPADSNKIDSAEFMHPFSCKVLGPRGSGKTSFTVSYIQKVACFTFPKVFIVTTSPNQPLYTTLKGNDQIFF